MPVTYEPIATTTLGSATLLLVILGHAYQVTERVQHLDRLTLILNGFLIYLLAVALPFQC